MTIEVGAVKRSCRNELWGAEYGEKRFTIEAVALVDYGHRGGGATRGWRHCVFLAEKDDDILDGVDE